MTAATQVDLSGYTVVLTPSPLGTWTWEATTPMGQQLPGWSRFVSRVDAEQDALTAIERHALGSVADLVLSGEELRNRVQGNQP